MLICGSYLQAHSITDQVNKTWVYKFSSEIPADWILFYETFPKHCSTPQHANYKCLAFDFFNKNLKYL